MGIKDLEKKQKAMRIAAIVFAVAGVTFLVIKLRGNVQVKKKEKTETTFKLTEKEAKEKERALFEKQKEELEKLKAEQARISSLLEKINQQLEEQKKQLQLLEQQKQKEENKKVKKVRVKEKVVSFEEAKKRAEREKPPLPPPPPGFRPLKAMKNRKKGATVAGIEKVSFAKELEKRKKEVEQKKFETLRKFYLPSGTFVDGVLLTGLDAPTGVGARKNTIPVLITLADNSILPNDWKYDLKDCRIIGEATGDLSSERVKIRTDYMSCVDDEGNVYDFSLMGYVVGEDGKEGVRGRVVSKQGAIIARAMLAGFFEGVNNAFQASATTTQITATGTTIQTINPGQAVRAGVFAGAANAAKKLSDYYLQLLDQTFPVIEVGAGRRVTIVVQKGRWIEKVGKTEDKEKVEVKEAK